jgi:haloacetate dehalogenase
MGSGFIHKKIQIEDCSIDVRIAGNGNPLLLLHGFPETKLAWEKIVPALVATNTIVTADIPGYGASTGPAPASDYANYSKRRMGNVMNLLMQQLGFDSYDVAGHDRGARIAYRMALDHPQKLRRLAILNVIPAIEVAERMNYDRAYNMETWFFLSQPEPFPETLIKSNPEFYLNHILNSWSVDPKSISKESREAYLTNFKSPGMIGKICAEYRATKLDMQHDSEARRDSIKIQCPTLVLWSQNDFPPAADSPLSIWRNWANSVSGMGLPCGHFLMEELPGDVSNELLTFFR